MAHTPPTAVTSAAEPIVDTGPDISTVDCWVQGYLLDCRAAIARAFAVSDDSIGWDYDGPDKEDQHAPVWFELQLPRNGPITTAVEIVAWVDQRGWSYMLDHHSDESRTWQCIDLDPRAGPSDVAGAVIEACRRHSPA